MSSIFDHKPFSNYKDDWAARCRRYDLYRTYYRGEAYDKLRPMVSSPIVQHQLYEGTRTLFSPLRRAVRVDVAKIPAGWAMDEQVVSKATIERVKQLRKLSEAETAYSRFLRYAAVAGEAALMLSGNPAEPRPEALRPDELVLGQFEDGTPFALIVKRKTHASLGYLGQSYQLPSLVEEYAQVITEKTVTTYRDGVPHAYDAETPERPNAFTFIPVVFAQFNEGEDGIGEPSFAGVLELLDRVNEIASLTLDVITRNAEPRVVGTGVTEVEVDDEHDAILTQNAEAKFYTLDPKLAIADTLAFIQDVRSEFKNQLPQLRIDDLKGLSDLAYDTVVTLLQELGDHIIAVRTSIDSAVESIERWMLGASGQGIPDDYELHRDRRWMHLTEMQQLELEAKRLGIQGLKKSFETPQNVAPGAQPQENRPDDRTAGNPSDTSRTDKRPADRSGSGD